MQNKEKRTESDIISISDAEVMSNDADEDDRKELDKMSGDSIRAMTGDDDPVSDRDEEPNLEELGGPFIETERSEELGGDGAPLSWDQAARPSPMRVPGSGSESD